MSALVSTIGSVVAIVFSVSSIIFSAINLVQVKKTQIISGITQNRIHWIENVRTMTMDFIEMFNIHRPAAELETQMYKIKLFMREDVESYKQMIKAMENCCNPPADKERKSLLDELTRTTQEVLAEVWRRTKAEAGMSKNMDKIYSNISTEK